jgi:hypothetical protein
MKLGLILIIMCCYSKNDNSYVYEAKNAQDTTKTGLLYSAMKYNEGDTVIIK